MNQISLSLRMRTLIVILSIIILIFTTISIMSNYFFNNLLHKKSYISGIVFNDVNSNGVWDPGELGIPDVTIDLYDSMELIAVITTDSNGAYSFTILKSGDYAIKEKDPLGYLSTTSNLYNVKVDIKSGQNYIMNFGDTELNLATIHGIVYEDKDRDGALDTEELGILGVNVSLFDSTGLIAVDITGSNGLFSFSDLEPGFYTVNETDLPGWYSTAPNQVALYVGPGESHYMEFGDDKLTNATVYGIVFSDEDGDHILDIGEPRIEGVKLSLYGITGFIDTNRTNSKGVYLFTVSTPGLYTLNKTGLPGWYSTAPDMYNINIELNRTYEFNFAQQQYASIFGTIFDDEDKDGRFDTRERGISGVTIKLYRENNLVNETTATSDGAYSFIDLESGHYKIVESSLLGWVNTTSHVINITIKPGKNYKINFGLRKCAKGILGRTKIGSRKAIIFANSNIFERNELIQEICVDRITIYGYSNVPDGSRVRAAIYSNRVSQDGYDSPWRLLAVSEEKVWSYGVGKWHVHHLLTHIHLTPGIYHLVFVCDSEIYYFVDSNTYDIYYSGEPQSYKMGFPEKAPDNWLPRSRWGGASIYAGVSEQ